MYLFARIGLALFVLFILVEVVASILTPAPLPPPPAAPPPPKPPKTPPPPPPTKEQLEVERHAREMKRLREDQDVSKIAFYAARALVVGLVSDIEEYFQLLFAADVPPDLQLHVRNHLADVFRRAAYAQPEDGPDFEEMIRKIENDPPKKFIETVARYFHVNRGELHRFVLESTFHSREFKELIRETARSLDFMKGLPTPPPNGGASAGGAPQPPRRDESWR